MNSGIICQLYTLNVVLEAIYWWVAKNIFGDGFCDGKKLSYIPYGQSVNHHPDIKRQPRFC